MQVRRIALVLLVVIVGVLALLMRSRDAANQALRPGVDPGESAAPVAESPFVSPELEAAIVAERSPAEIGEIVEALAGEAAESGNSDRATLRVTLTWGDDGSPAEEVSTKVVAWGAPNPIRDALHGITDSEGMFVLEELFPGTTTLYVDRGGTGSVELVAGETAELAITIPAGINLHGRVLGPDGEPVPHAAVFLSNYGNTSDGDVVTTSDAQGRYRIRGVGEARCVAAWARGFSPSGCVDVPGDAGEAIELDLLLPAAGVTLEGRVRGPNGLPIAGAAVLIGDGDRAPRVDAVGERSNSPPPRALRTDELGRFVVTGLEARTSSVAVRAPELAPWSEKVDLRAGEDKRIEIELQAGGAIRGTVWGAEGQPAEGVFVGVGRYADFLATQTQSAADGSYRLAGLAPRETTVRATDRDRGKSSATLTLVAGIDTPWDARLVKGGSVGGRVVDEAGLALADWQVMAIDPLQPTTWHKSTRTAASGSFLLENCPPGDFHLAVCDPAGSVLAPSLVVREFQRDDTNLLLVVKDTDRATAWVVGRVLEAEGKKPSGTELHSWEAGENIGLNQGESIGEDGSFRVGPFKAGSYRFDFSARDLATRIVQVDDLRAGEERDLGDIVLEPAGAVVIHLARSDGEAVDQGVWCTLDPIGGGGRQFASHESGVGRIASLAPGSWIVRARGLEFACAMATVEVIGGAETRVDLTLDPGTHRTVSLVVPAGVELQFVSVVATDASGRALLEEEFYFTPDTGKHFGLYGLGLGTHRVRAEAGDYSGEIELVIESLEPSGEMASIELR